jgi:hypothetical protein
MTNPEKIKTKLGETAEKIEAKVNDFFPYYTNLEPWQRGVLILVLIILLLTSIHLLTKKETPQPRELTDEEKKSLERLVEERILKRAEFLRKLQGQHV